MNSKFVLRPEDSIPDPIGVLDIGTSKVTLIIASFSDGMLSVSGVGTYKSEGRRKGTIVNISKTVEAIRRAREDAQQMAGTEISEVVVSVGGVSLNLREEMGIISIKNREVDIRDLQNVLDIATNFLLPVNSSIVNVIPKEYTVDHQTGVTDPVGIAGIRLEAVMKIVLGSAPAVDNIVNCVKRAGLKPKELVAEPIASALSVMTPEEQEMGVTVIDIGAGTTSVSIWKDKRLQDLFVMGVGGDEITKDIASALRTPPKYAEELKIRYGLATEEAGSSEDKIPIMGIGGRPQRTESRWLLLEIIKPRLEEIFQNIAVELKRRNVDMMYAGGVILTGGQSALPGMAELAGSILNFPVRVATPSGVTGLSSVVESGDFATSVGLAKFVAYPGISNDPRAMWPLTPQENAPNIMEGIKRLLSKIKRTI